MNMKILEKYQSFCLVYLSSLIIYCAKVQTIELLTLKRLYNNASFLT